jgi:hypothetical protein
MHLPWSPGLQNDDRVMPSLDFMKGKEVVVTEKMDGENTTMYRDGIHARSIDGRYHSSRDWVKGHWAQTCMSRLAPGSRICGENVYAQHSIRYDNLKTYFYGFSYWDGNVCFDWDDTLQLFAYFDITPVPLLYRGTFCTDTLQDLASEIDTDKHEGLVVRVAESFTIYEFPYAVGKWVRRGHVQTDEHWMHKEVVPNGLSG